MSLLASRRLAPLFITQTLGAFNDNLFKNALAVLILIKAGQSGPALVSLAGGVFILPYLLLSATAGQVADRFDKARTILAMKVAEVALMALAAAAFFFDGMPLLFVVLFGLGVQATFFGPLKYAILPSHLAEDELVAGNGLVEAGTFLGILAGTIAGAWLLPRPQGLALVSVIGVAAALAGLASAAFIRPAPSATPGRPLGWNIVHDTARLLAAARANRPVWLSILGLSWFWVVGATVVAQLPTLVHDLQADEQVLPLLLAFFSIGVGAGSMLCSRLLRGQITARLVPFAALGLSLFLGDFSVAVRHVQGLADPAALLASLAGWRMLIDLLLLGFCGGLYSVPLYAIIQHDAAPDRQGSMIAANNAVNAAAIVGGAILAALLATAAVAPATILLVTALATLAVAAWIVRIIPQTTMRALFRWYFHTFHGVDVAGLENLPAPGQRAVIVVNHQSFLDGCFVAAFLPNEPVFAVNIHTARLWWARPLLALVRNFPVDPANPYSTKTMTRAVQAGQTLVIFPEGRLTTTGALMKVYEGAGMIADKAGAVLVPVHIDGLQFSPLTRLGRRAPHRLFPRLSLTVLPPVAVVPVAVAPDPELQGRPRRRAVGLILQDVMEAAGFATARTDRTLFAALAAASRRAGPRTPILEDIERKPVPYRRVLLGAALLGRRLSQEAPPGGALGVLLPNSVGAVITFMGLQAFARVPAMLNVSAGAEAMLSACTAAQVTTVISSRAFIERGKLAGTVARMERQVRFLYLEDVRPGLGLAAKLRAWLDARFPTRLPGANLPADAPAVILFTSGSEGTPKGVVLSHCNILANIAQVATVVDFNAADRVFNAMPMFHSFGLTGGTLLPLLSGVRTFLYPSPLHYRIVPELIYDTDSTIAFGTDTFLAGWARFAHPYDFYAVRYIFSGAEKLRDETRRIYAERFGVRVLEGYGATETAPVLALNSPMHSRPGAAGRLLPGIEHRLDPVPGIPDGGRLVVRGPNVMLGYLRTAAPGLLEPPEHNWYDTGDVCTVDAERFVTIVARAKRFAKIAGEMVSMPAAEALAASLWPDAAHAVVAIPDDRKGEALVLLTTQQDATPAALLAQARTQATPEIAAPRQIRILDTLPLLATGKTDYPTATHLATEQRASA